MNCGFASWFPVLELITIAVLGLDQAGKTTTVKALEGVPTDCVTPTLGYCLSHITHKNGKINLVDLGGVSTFRDSWKHYYDDSHGFIYVIDSSEMERIEENQSVFEKLLQEDKVKGKPILILANKQDKPSALDENGILKALNIEKLLDQHKTLCRVILCTAQSLGRANKINESITHGFDWLVKTINAHYEDLRRRVDNDVQIKKQIESIEKSERAERVKKIRE
ncbi:unnamed protein product, partial [Didymodactylos carnosus]